MEFGAISWQFDSSLVTSQLKFEFYILLLVETPTIVVIYRTPHLFLLNWFSVKLADKSIRLNNSFIWNSFRWEVWIQCNSTLLPVGWQNAPSYGYDELCNAKIDLSVEILVIFPEQAYFWLSFPRCRCCL